MAARAFVYAVQFTVRLHIQFAGYVYGWRRLDLETEKEVDPWLEVVFIFSAQPSQRQDQWLHGVEGWLEEGSQWPEVVEVQEVLEGIEYPREFK